VVAWCQLNVGTFIDYIGHLNLTNPDSATQLSNAIKSMYKELRITEFITGNLDKPLAKISHDGTSKVHCYIEFKSSYVRETSVMKALNKLKTKVPSITKIRLHNLQETYIACFIF
jgi:hypothetical protein